MIRITIEEVPEPTMVPRGPCRREGDMMVPQAMLEPVVVYQQAWVANTPQPNLGELIAHLNDLKTEELCANCGHEKSLHVGGIGKCLVGDGGFSQSCRCEGYVTAEGKQIEDWKQASLRADQLADEARAELAKATGWAMETAKNLEAARKMNGTLQCELLDVGEKLTKAQKDLRASRKVVRDMSKRRGK